MMTRTMGSRATVPTEKGRNVMKRWKHRPEVRPGGLGRRRQQPRLNLITPKKVLGVSPRSRKACRSASASRSISPGGNVLNPRRPPRCCRPPGQNGWRFNFHTETINPLFMDVASDDRVIADPAVSTAMGHPRAHTSAACSTPTATASPKPLLQRLQGGLGRRRSPARRRPRDGCGHLSYAHKLGVENMAAKATRAGPCWSTWRSTTAAAISM